MPRQFCPTFLTFWGEELSTVLTKNYKELPSPDKSEILKYAGANNKSEELAELLSECIFESKNSFIGKLCWSEFDVTLENDLIDFGFTAVRSRALSKNLNGCNKVVIFAATVGSEIDRLINKFSKISPVKALIFNAIGCERIETVCDLFCEEIKVLYRNAYDIHPRFSPGYGDLELNFQKTIFSLIDCPKKIGLTLTDSLLMSPSKSVTAIIGLSKIK